MFNVEFHNIAIVLVFDPLRVTIFLYYTNILITYFSKLSYTLSYLLPYLLP